MDTQLVSITTSYKYKKHCTIKVSASSALQDKKAVLLYVKFNRLFLFDKLISKLDYGLKNISNSDVCLKELIKTTLKYNKESMGKISPIYQARIPIP